MRFRRLALAGADPLAGRPGGVVAAHREVRPRLAPARLARLLSPAA